MAVAGVRKNEPATIVAMNGRPKSAKGCLLSDARYRAASVFASLEGRYFLLVKTAIVRNWNFLYLSKQIGSCKRAVNRSQFGRRQVDSK